MIWRIGSRRDLRRRTMASSARCNGAGEAIYTSWRRQWVTRARRVATCLRQMCPRKNLRNIYRRHIAQRYLQRIVNHDHCPACPTPFGPCVQLRDVGSSAHGTYLGLQCGSAEGQEYICNPERGCRRHRRKQGPQRPLPPTPSPITNKQARDISGVH